MNAAPGRRRPPLSDEVVELIAARMRVMAEPFRLRLLRSLNDREATVGRLRAELGTSHQNISKHLHVLHDAGMVARRKADGSVVWALVDWSGWWLVEQIGQSVADHLERQRALFADFEDPPESE